MYRGWVERVICEINAPAFNRGNTVHTQDSWQKGYRTTTDKKTVEPNNRHENLCKLSSMGGSTIRGSNVQICKYIKVACAW